MIEINVVPITSKEIRDELSALGFSGLLLRSLLDYIVDDDSLQSFFNFIIRMDEKEERITQVLLVYKFIVYMQDKQSYKDSNEYISAYAKSKTIDEKQEVLAKLFLSNSPKLIEVIFWIDNDMISNDTLYHLAVQNRCQFSVEESLLLIETLHI